MCLDRVTKGEKIPSVGYKVMLRKKYKLRKDSLVGQFQNSSKSRPMKKWLKEEDFRCSDDAREQLVTTLHPARGYPRGWHIFRNLDDALHEIMWEKDFVSTRTLDGRAPHRDLVVVEVEMKEVVATGIQHFHGTREVIVAKQIKITRIIDG